MRALDLFAGAGGLGLGLSEAGIEVELSVDSWQVAVENHERNLKHPVHCLDLSDPRSVKYLKSLRPDLVAGGPPCQDFSSAGPRREGDRATLTEAFAEIVAECRPELLLMENVPRIRYSEAWRKAKLRLVSAGYEIRERVLNAHDFGAPQIRRRIFVFGSLGGIDETRLDEAVGGLVDPARPSVKDHLGDEIEVEHYYRHPRSYNRRAVFSVREPSPTVRGVNRQVAPGYRRNLGDTADPSEVRALTSRQRGLIQTFPPGWEWSGSGSDVEQLIGNAVPVALAKVVGKTLLSTI